MPSIPELITEKLASLSDYNPDINLTGKPYSFQLPLGSFDENTINHGIEVQQLGDGIKLIGTAGTNLKMIRFVILYYDGKLGYYDEGTDTTKKIEPKNFSRAHGNVAWELYMKRDEMCEKANIRLPDAHIPAETTQNTDTVQQSQSAPVAPGITTFQSLPQPASDGRPSSQQVSPFF